MKKLDLLVILFRYNKNANSDFVNGREFTISTTGSETVGGTTYYYVEASTAGLNFPDSDFSLSVADANDSSKYIFRRINSSRSIF